MWNSKVYFALKCQHGAAITSNTRVKCKKLSTMANAGKRLSYQFLQKSEIPTMYFQKSLPRLPIPAISDTCNRFLQATKPLVAANDDYNALKQTVAKFQNEEGAKLNSLLLQNDTYNKHTSYISKPWSEMYLSDRAPLPLNYNPLLVFKQETNAKHQSQIARAANLIISSLRFWRSLQAEVLDPEIYFLQKPKDDMFKTLIKLAPTRIATYVAYLFKAYPLDMSQYHSLFGTTRIPSPNTDYLLHDEFSKHILVMRRGNFYAMDVLKEDGSIEEPEVILLRLNSILQIDSKKDCAEFPLGVLTFQNRDIWAALRQHLINDISVKNFDKMQQIDKALFCVCLDTADDPVYNDIDPTPQLKNLLAGHGKNRWFDKSVSLLVSADGTAAVNFEHSWGDGVAVLRFFNEVFDDVRYIDESMANALTLIEREPHVRELEFDLDDHVRSKTVETLEANLETMKNFNMGLLRYPHLNKNICKEFNVSPDAIMQLAFQLAYRQAFGNYVGSYESCSTAAFRHGRTETVRPCTIATTQFCEAFLQTNKSTDNELFKMIASASNHHSKLIKEAAMGQGFDRHLFALKHQAAIHNLNVPEIFQTDAYKKINYNIISTSTLSSNALLAGCFGPVVQDGYGIGYSIQNEECGSIVTSYKNHGNGKLLLESLENAFCSIKNILINGGHRKS